MFQEMMVNSGGGGGINLDLSRFDYKSGSYSGSQYTLTGLSGKPVLVVVEYLFGGSWYQEIYDYEHTYVLENHTSRATKIVSSTDDSVTIQTVTSSSTQYKITCFY